MQHLNDQVEPVGHAVRFAYLETAAAMLANQTQDPSLIPTLEKVWKRMVTRRMYVTGGIGFLPHIEGFGRDYELDPEVAYTETCAALGCLFWNREMSLLTGNLRYDDLLNGSSITQLAWDSEWTAVPFFIIIPLSMMEIFKGLAGTMYLVAHQTSPAPGQRWEPIYLVMTRKK